MTGVKGPYLFCCRRAKDDPLKSVFVIKTTFLKNKPLLMGKAGARKTLNGVNSIPETARMPAARRTRCAL
jgi:hypothetical protein